MKFQTKKKGQEKDHKPTSNVTYYSVFRRMKSQVKELHVLLAYDESHVKVIPGVPTIGFRNNKNLKSH